MTEEQVLRWIINAVADGWTIEPTYPHESADKAASLDKEGYHALTLARSELDVSISVWGSDELHVDVPETYDWDVMVRGTRICMYCGAVGNTVRIGFAGRCCPECREEHKAKVEFSGWTS